VTNPPPPPSTPVETKSRARSEWIGLYFASNWKLLLARIALLAGILTIWELLSGTLIEEFWISKPSDIAVRLWEWLQSGYLVTHFGVTLKEMALGLAIGSGLGILAGLGLGLNPFFGRLVDPFVSAAYSVPKLALVPLFILWFGIGLKMILVLVIAITFFVVFWNAYAGAQDADDELLDILRVMGASRRNRVLKVIVPGAMTYIFVGLKLAIPLSLAGAIVGELVASNSGLGYVLKHASGQFDITGVMAALCLLLVIGASINSLLNTFENRILRWRLQGVETMASRRGNA
jgi:NitT/TauT family transport system permease protein